VFVKALEPVAPVPVEFGVNDPRRATGVFDHVRLTDRRKDVHDAADHVFASDFGGETFLVFDAVLERNYGRSVAEKRVEITGGRSSVERLDTEQDDVALADLHRIGRGREIDVKIAVGAFDFETVGFERFEVVSPRDCTSAPAYASRPPKYPPTPPAP